MVVAFIPVRGGSKSIPLKNIKPFCGKPLVCWNIEALANCSEVDEIIVATDSDKIEEIELEITNPYCNDLALGAIPGMFKQGVVTTFIDRGEEEFVPNLKTKVFTGDILHLVGPSVYLKEMKI